MICFHALITHLYNELSHRYSYQLCFREAIKQLGFEYKGYTNKSCSIADIPNEWERCLSFRDEKRAAKKILQFTRRLLNFITIFGRKKEQNERRFFFLESLCMTDLVALTLTLIFFSKRDDSFWLQLRYTLPFNPYKWKVHNVCFRLIQKKMGNKLTLLTDSERIANFYEKRLDQKVHLIPIPQPSTLHSPKKPSDKLILWWPGEPRFDKGFKEIQELAKQCTPTSVELRLSEQGRRGFQSASFSPVFLKPILSREEYREHFHQCDAVLLPYDPKIYHSRSSGIFVEAVSAGRFPLVKEGSWLAQELHNYNLSELVLDWSRSDLLTHITALLNNERVWDKFHKMQSVYLVYHSQKSYMKELGNIFKCSQRYPLQH